MAMVGMALTAVSGVVTALGQISQGNAAKAQGDYQAAVLRNNKILADRAAEDAVKRGDIAEGNQAYETKALIGRQRAQFAANGVDVNVGSAVDIQSDTAAIGQQAQLTIRSNAAREALGYRTQGMNFAADAGLAEARGKSAQTAGYMSAFGTVLDTAGSVASKWYSK